MKPINPLWLGLGIGGAGAVFYVGCAVIMAVLPHELTIRFFNSLMHGFDVSTVMRWDIPLLETLIGIAATFVLGGIFGGIVGGIYNLGSAGKRTSDT